MFLLNLFIIIGLCLSVVIAQVHDLNEVSYKKIENGDWLLKFYAPWCGHCKSMEPAWQEAARQLRGKVYFGSIDCTQHKSICENVKGYPTLKAKLKGVPELVEYKSGRDAESLIKYAEFMIKPPVQPMNSETKLRSDAAAFILFLPASSDSLLKENFASIGNRMKQTCDFLLVEESDPSYKDMRKVYDISGDSPSLIAMKEDVKLTYTSTDFHVSAMTDWMITRQFSLMPELGRHSTSLINSGNPLLMFIYDKDDIESTKKGKASALEFAKKAAQSSDVELQSYVVVDAEINLYSKFIYSNFGIDIVLPQIVLWKPMESEYYLELEPTTGRQLQVEDFDNFISDVRAGKLAVRGGYLDSAIKNARLTWERLAELYWRHPVIGTIVIIVPLSILLFVCYLIIFDTGEYDYEDEDETKGSQSVKVDGKEKKE